MPFGTPSLVTLLGHKKKKKEMNEEVYKFATHALSPYDN